MNTKPFDQEAHDTYDPPAREAVAEWVFHTWGMRAFPNPDKYGVDLLVKRSGNVVGYIEVEARNWSQEETKCPYKTIHIAQRKYKLLDNELPTLFFAVTRDFRNAYWCKSAYVLESPLKEIPNKDVKEGEYFYDVPIEKFSYIDLELPF